jgi:hypothetical protein
MEGMLIPPKEGAFFCRLLQESRQTGFVKNLFHNFETSRIILPFFCRYRGRAMSLAFQREGLGSFSGFLVHKVAPRQVCLRLIQFLGAFAKLRKATVSFVMSVPASTWKNSVPTGCIFMKFDFWVFFENLSRKFKFHQNRARITGTLYEDQYTFLIISKEFVVGWKDVSEIKL